MATTEEGIYYPDDYTKSADILADMKQMAESVDKVIQDEKENQEMIEQTIQEIQTEQTAQNKKIEQLDDNQIHITTEKSDNLNVQDSSGQNGKIKLFGISEQETRSGKNKLKLTNQNYTNAGLNWEATETEVKINGTATGTYSVSNLFECDIKAGTYKFLAGGDSSFVYRIWLYNTTNEMIKYATSGEQFTITEDIVKYQLVFDNITVGNTYNTTFKPMILEATEQDESFERYGASPSPEFPSEIENTTGDIDITVCNKNLFNENDENAFKYGIGADKTIRNDDGTFTTTANYSSSRNKGTKLTGLKDNTDYTVSLDIININSTGNKNAEIEILENLDNGSTVAVLQKTVNAGINTVEFNSSSYKNLSLHISGFTVSGNTISTTFKDVQVAEKSSDNTYIEHEEQLITFPLAEGQKMYDGDYLASDGIHHVRKQTELDGTENWIALGINYYLAINDKKTRYEPTKGKMLCTHFKETTTSVTGEVKVGEFFEGYYVTGNRNVFFNYDNGVGGVANWKSYLAQQKQAGTPVIVEYELETEEIEAYTPEQQEAYNQLQNAKTYKTVTNVFTENAELEMEYIADTKTYVDNQINQRLSNLENQVLELAGGN